MSQLSDDDPLLRAIAALPVVQPDEASARALRTRCRERLEHPAVRLPVLLEPATVSSVCAVYAWQIVVVAVRSTGG